MASPDLIAEIHGLKQSIDVLREALDGIAIILDHLDRNRNDIRYAVYNMVEKPQESSETLPQSVTCFTCDSTADSLAEAVKEGWNDLQEDPKGLSWNYLGTCPTCRTEEAAETVPAKDPKSKDSLF